MAFELYTDVILTRDVVERGLRAGDVGTAVERHVVAGVAEDGYRSSSLIWSATPLPWSQSLPVPCACPLQRIGPPRGHSARRPSVKHSRASGPQAFKPSQPHDDVVPTGEGLVHHPSLTTLRRASFGWQANLRAGSGRRTPYKASLSKWTRDTGDSRGRFAIQR